MAALSSGVAAGIAILIRANLAPVAVVPAAMLLVRPAEARRSTPVTRADSDQVTTGLGALSGRDRLPDRRGRYVLWFAAGVVPAAVAIAVLYNYWYGSPLNSGYGTLEQLYSAANLVPNLSHYAQWLTQSQTPVILAGLVTPFLVAKRFAAVGLLVFVTAVALCYVFYIPFGAWWYLRFLLPAFPAMLALTATSLVAISRRLPRQLRAVAIVVMLAAIARYTVGYAADRSTFDSGGEQKYAITGHYVAEHLPVNAVIFSEQHSGGIRYYSNRTTIRFGSIPADHLEGSVAELVRRGYQPYLVAEDWEEEAFRRQFAGRRILSVLDAGPQVELPLGKVRIYPLAR